jgi:hypothetical protein
MFLLERRTNALPRSRAGPWKRRLKLGDLGTDLSFVSGHHGARGTCYVKTLRGDSRL